MSFISRSYHQNSVIIYVNNTGPPIKQELLLYQWHLTMVWPRPTFRLILNYLFDLVLFIVPTVVCVCTHRWKHTVLAQQRPTSVAAATYLLRSLIQLQKIFWNLFYFKTGLPSATLDFLWLPICKNVVCLQNQSCGRDLHLLVLDKKDIGISEFQFWRNEMGSIFCCMQVKKQKVFK